MHSFPKLTLFPLCPASNIECVRICQIVEARGHKNRLYTSLHVPENSWEDISMYFILGIHKKQRGHSSVLVVVDIFYNMAHVIPCKKTSDATHETMLFF